MDQARKDKIAAIGQLLRAEREATKPDTDAIKAMVAANRTVRLAKLKAKNADPEKIAKLEARIAKLRGTS